MTTNDKSQHTAVERYKTDFMLLLLAMIALAVGLAALYASRKPGDALSSLEYSFKLLSKEILG